MYPTFNELKKFAELQLSQQNTSGEEQRSHPFWHQMSMLQSQDRRDFNIADLEKEQQKTQDPPDQILPFSWLKEAMRNPNSSILPVGTISTNQKPQLDPSSRSFIVTEAQIVPSQTTDPVEEATLNTTPGPSKGHPNSMVVEEKIATPIMYGLDESSSVALTANLEQEQKTSQSMEDETIATAITPTESVDFNQPQAMDVSHKLEETVDDSSISSLVQDEQVEASQTQTIVQSDVESLESGSSMSTLENTIESGEQLEGDVSPAETKKSKNTDRVDETASTNCSQVPVVLFFLEEETEGEESTSLSTTSLQVDQFVEGTSKNHQPIEKNEEQGSEQQGAQTALLHETLVDEESDQGANKEKVFEKEKTKLNKIWNIFRRR